MSVENYFPRKSVGKYLPNILILIKPISTVPIPLIPIPIISILIQISGIS